MARAGRSMTTADKLQRIMNDPYLFISTFMKIVDKNGQAVPFKPNIQQTELLSDMEKFNVILKSRQLGISVLSAAYMIWLCMTKPNVDCALMAHSLDGVKDIFAKLKRLYYDLPTAIRKPAIIDNKFELKFVNGSGITGSVVGKKESVRGRTLRFVHMSEAGFCSENIEKQILAVEQCLTSDGQIVIESTANGFNYFSDVYFRAERKESLYKPFFFSWIDDKVMFAAEYKDFAQRYINLHGALPTVEELDSSEKSLYHRGATIEQLVWRRLKISNSSEASFCQEFPSSPSEAFISTGSNVFDTQKIHERLQYVHDTKTVPISELLPTVLKPWYNRGFTMWEAPEPGTRYFCGVDSAEGLGGDSDYSVVEVVDRSGFQVAEFRNNKIKPYQFTEVVHAIAMYFNKAFLVVEKASAGQTVCDRLFNDPQYYYKRMYRHRNWDARGKKGRKVGFETTAKSKQILISDYVEQFDTDGICINSEILLQEMKMFVFQNGSTGASPGHHDDTVMAMAMALLGAKEAPDYIDI